ncbi:hypothetical protein D3C75_1016170 [compost metagenome]
MDAASLAVGGIPSSGASGACGTWLSAGSEEAGTALAGALADALGAALTDALGAALADAPGAALADALGEGEPWVCPGASVASGSASDAELQAARTSIRAARAECPNIFFTVIIEIPSLCCCFSLCI